MYRSSTITETLTSKEESALQTEEDCRMAMVLVALLAGGDYIPEGLTAFGTSITMRPSLLALTTGPVIALGLAHAGFAEILKSYISDPVTFESQFGAYHSRMVDELRTNSSGHIGRRYPDRANKLSTQGSANLFPSSALESYLDPVISLSRGPAEWPGFGNGERSIRRGKARNEGRGDLEGMARACEKFFEWGTKDRVVRKFARDTVGVYGIQLVNAARNAVRLQARQGQIMAPLVSSQGASNSRITSFFPEVRSSQPMGKSTFISSKASSSTQASHAAPDHIVQIHSTRTDPTDPDQNEFRISFEHAPYTARVRGAMLGDRVDPNDLDAEMKAVMGLVDRGPDEDAPTAELKNEVRVWIAEYLVRSAWPDLVRKYDDGLRIKEAAKLAKGRPRMKKTVSNSSSKDERVDSDAFKSFFTVRSTAATVDKQGQGSSQAQSGPMTDSDSDIEIIDDPTSIPKLSTLERTRHHPTSSISSLSSLRSPTPPARFSLPSRLSTRARSKVSPQPRSTRSVNSSTRIKSGSKITATEIVDLCSSDDETPKAARTRILSPIAAPNVPTPRREGRWSLRSSPKKARAGASPPSRLDLPVIASTSQVMASKSSTLPRTPQKTVKARTKKYACVVLSETSDEELIDMIQRD